jgi:hypothetical protein
MVEWIDDFHEMRAPGLEEMTERQTAIGLTHVDILGRSA